MIYAIGATAQYYTSHVEKRKLCMNENMYCRYFLLHLLSVLKNNFSCLCKIKMQQQLTCCLMRVFVPKIVRNVEKFEVIPLSVESDWKALMSSKL